MASPYEVADTTRSTSLVVKMCAGGEAAGVEGEPTVPPTGAGSQEIEL